jgi:hypothetical protein
MQDIEKFYELNQQLTMDDLARKKFTHTQAREKIKQFLANRSLAKKSRENRCFPREGGLLVGQNRMISQNHKIFLVSKRMA